MGIKLASTAFALLAFSLISLTIPLVAAAETSLGSAVLAQSAPTFEEVLIQSQLGAQWMAAFALLMAAIAAVAGIDRYLKDKQWKRRELARSVVEDFTRRKAIRNVADILDFEEYRLFETRLPEDDRLIRFEATDERLQRALRSHDQMVKTRRGLNILTQMAEQPGKMDENTVRVLEKYRDEEFVLELTLRDWFDEFLGALEACENAIVAGIVTAEDLKPFIYYWVQVISDRRFRRDGGSGFYDQLFHYIYWAGYTGVQSLFERYGYKILPPPYSTHDFVNIDRDNSVMDAFRALCMAKAAHLVYEDQEYVEDIVRLWLSDDSDNRWMKQNPADYAIDVIKHWLKEGDSRRNIDISDSYKYLLNRVTDTQAFIFRKNQHIVLVFRGSQQSADWGTNFKFRMKQFAITYAQQDDAIPTGEVHRGFQDAWQSVEKRVLYRLKKWWTPETQFWITGHSLGGALAALAATSLEYQGFPIAGLYTFGQPRVGDWSFTRQVNTHMGDRMFRYVNNNDVVPLIPPQVNPLNPGRLYGHMGIFRYFDRRGKLHDNSYLSQRWLDRLLGFIAGLGQPGADIVADHKMEFYVRYLQKELDIEKDRLKAKREDALEAREILEMNKAR
ncbi:lipase family protein [Oscillatoria sp. CS-180]|uniref:lipase family protein n=1 Tax=Oscillatoria sp. CS-180 TaxID=3021720 RepID=UPI00232B4302|nr:lipase family protein [Oscillatoria sp. CS-180]MDB9528634.1 lipase family protein [Oscillatoria sp. CS-180]